MPIIKYKPSMRIGNREHTYITVLSSAGKKMNTSYLSLFTGKCDSYNTVLLWWKINAH